MSRDFDSRSRGSIDEWLVPLAFIIPAAWVVWRVPGFILTLGGGTDSMGNRFPVAGLIDWVALALLPILFLRGLFGKPVASVWSGKPRQVISGP